jgi:ABC-type tungstate transport system permease subunit
VTPDDPESPEARKAVEFITWLTSIETQELIEDFGKDMYGQPLFYPASNPWCESHGGESQGCS